MHAHFSQRGLAFQSHAKRAIEGLLAEWFGEPVVLKQEPKEGTDFLGKVHRHTLLIELEASATPVAIAKAVARLRRAPRGTVPVVAVPYMSDSGRKACTQAEVSWIDLSGNADLRAPGLRVLIEGRPNQYARAGRPASPFAPKSSRLARRLLMNPDRPASQRELATATGLDPGRISRLVARLKEQGLVRLDAAGRVELADRRLMLEAWRADYRFERHYTVRGHIPAKTGTDVVEKLGRALRGATVNHAFTGLAGAWEYSHTAGFRLVTVYVPEIPSARVLQAVDFVEQEKGSNVWLVVPDDPRVFDGAHLINGHWCAHPVQVWLDLGAQPERANDAAHDLFDLIMSGAFDG